VEILENCYNFTTFSEPVLIDVPESLRHSVEILENCYNFTTFSEPVLIDVQGSIL